MRGRAAIRLTSPCRLTAAALLALPALLATGLAGGPPGLAPGTARAATPLRPLAGSVVHTAAPRFTVRLDAGETDPEVEVRAAGSTATPRSCSPITPAGGPRTFSCALVQPLVNGRYSWVLSWRRQACRVATSTAGTARRTCSSHDVQLGPIRFTVAVPPPPARPAAIGPLAPRPAGGGESRIDPNYGRIAAAISGRPAAVVRCWSTAGWAKLGRTVAAADPRHIGLAGATGFVSESAPSTIELAPAVCARLDALAYGGAAPAGTLPAGAAARLALAESVEALVHEAVHVHGYVLSVYGDEAETYAECYGLQEEAWAARQLGASDADARALAAASWADYAPRYARTNYFSADCRDGGRLDLRPGSSVFP